MVEMVEILDGRLGQRSVERVRYVINNLLHLVIVKYGDISLVLCISTRLRLVTILSLLVKYLVIFHADPCNKSYIYGQTRLHYPARLRAQVIKHERRTENWSEEREGVVERLGEIRKGRRERIEKGREKRKRPKENLKRRGAWETPLL